MGRSVVSISRPLQFARLLLLTIVGSRRVDCPVDAEAPSTLLALTVCAQFFAPTLGCLAGMASICRFAEGGL
jgi:hypothetical protein